MDYLVKIRSVQTPLNGQFSIGANSSLPMILKIKIYFHLSQKSYAFKIAVAFG